MTDRLSPALRFIARATATVCLAAAVPACSHFKSDGPDGEADAKPPAASEAVEAESDDGSSDKVDALAEEAKRFAEQGEQADASPMAPSGDDPPAAANAVQWLNDPEVPAKATGAGGVARVDSASAPRPSSEETRPAEPADAAESTADSTNDDRGGERPAPPEPEPMTRQEMLAELVKRTDLEADRSLRPWLARAALSVLDPTHELSEAELKRLSPEHRTTVVAYQRTLAQLGRTLGKDPAADARALRRAAHELADQLDQQQPLTIRNLKLCKSVKGFGVYQTFARNVFLARREHPVIVYAELDHFAHRTESDGRHAVELTQEIVLYNESDGLPVWRQKPTPIVDRSYNVREDFFVVQVVRLSPRLTVGKYRLKVTLTDEIGQTVDEAAIPIRIVADVGAAGAGD